MNDDLPWNKILIKANGWYENDVTSTIVEQREDKVKLGQRASSPPLSMFHPPHLYSAVSPLPHPHRNSVPFASVRRGGKT